VETTQTAHYGYVRLYRDTGKDLCVWAWPAAA